MRPIPFVLAPALALALLAAPHPSAAQFVTLRSSWGDCSPLVVDRTTVTPGVNVLVISGTGLTPGMSYAEFPFNFYPYRVAPAWQFYTADFFSGTPGCEGPGRLALDPSGTSCPIYPTTFYDVGMFQGSLTGPGRTVLVARLGLDPAFAADPAQRYTLARLVFDQSNAVAGPGGPGTCGGYDVPMCIVYGALFGRLDQAPVPIAFEQQHVTWQDASNSTGCPGSTPARATTWGQIKSQYH